MVPIRECGKGSPMTKHKSKPNAALDKLRSKRSAAIKAERIAKALFARDTLTANEIRAIVEKELKPCDIHIEPSEKESADDLIEQLIVAHRAYKAAGNPQIAEAEDMRYRILVELADCVDNSVELAPE